MDKKFYRPTLKNFILTALTFGVWRRIWMFKTTNVMNLYLVGWRGSDCGIGWRALCVRKPCLDH